MKNIRLISITGGTCAGKTQTFESLKKELKYENLEILYIEESGTDVMKSGINPSDSNVGLFNFQVINLKNQLNKEKLLKEAALLLKTDNVLIISDRTSYEQQVFIDRSAWNDVLNIVGVTNEELMNSYDGVFHLVSTAIGAEFAYGMLTNKNRIHTIEQAREQELKAQELWKEHQNFHIFTNEYSFDIKREKVISEVRKYIETNFDNVYEINLV